MIVGGRLRVGKGFSGRPHRAPGEEAIGAGSQLAHDKVSYQDLKLIQYGHALPPPDHACGREARAAREAIRDHPAQQSPADGGDGARRQNGCESRRCWIELQCLGRRGHRGDSVSTPGYRDGTPQQVVFPWPQGGSQPRTVPTLRVRPLAGAAGCVLAPAFSLGPAVGGQREIIRRGRLDPGEGALFAAGPASAGS